MTRLRASDGWSGRTVFFQTGKVMFTLNKLRDTLSHVGGVYGEASSTRGISILVGSVSQDPVEEWDFL
jgi:hypothetical protein